MRLTLCSSDKYRVSLEILQLKVKWGWDSSCSLHLGHRIFGTLPILYIGGLKVRKMDKFIPDRKNTTIIAFDKPISQKISPNIKTENKFWNNLKYEM